MVNDNFTFGFNLHNYLVIHPHFKGHEIQKLLHTVPNILFIFKTIHQKMLKLRNIIKCILDINSECLVNFSSRDRR